MSSYFDPSLLDEYDHIVFGPFLGDLYWEYAKWQSFIRWYTNLNQDKTYEIWTRGSRINLYSHILARVIRCDVGIDDLVKNYEPVGYTLKGLSPEREVNSREGIEDLYTDEVLVYHPPKIERGDFFNPKHMDLNLFFKYETYKLFQQLKYNMGERTPIAICPPDGKISGGVWEEIYNRFTDSDKYIVFRIKERNRKETILDNIFPPNFVNTFNYRDIFGMGLCAILNSNCVLGDESNPYFKIAKKLKFVKTYSISNKNGIDIAKVLKCNVKGV